MTQHIVYLICEAGGDDPGSLVREVHTTGGSVVLGETVLCATDDQRVKLALDKGFATRAERENVQVESITFEPRAAGWSPRWVLAFDTTKYQAMLDRL